MASWSDSAACAGMPLSTFFPSPVTEEDVADALAVCAGCPVRSSCLDEARAAKATEGIWGGVVLYGHVRPKPVPKPERRTRTHCKSGHPLDGDNVRLNYRGQRVCVTCVREWSRAGDKRRRAAAKTNTTT